MPDSMNDRVVVFPFSRQPDGTEVVIGRVDACHFVALPVDAVEILDDLASGSTVGEAQAHYQERYGNLPDIDGLLDGLEAEGFVQRRKGEATADGMAPSAAPEVKRTRELSRRYHFSTFPRPLAKAIFSRSSFVVGAILVALALASVIADWSIVPGWDALFFPKDFGTKLLWLVFFATLQICLHELAHLVAAKALGVSVRFGVGQRLWLVVLETDMSGIWAHPKRKRYLPILAGPMIDLVIAAVLVLVLSGQNLGFYALSPYWLDIVNVMVIVYFYQLIWQCFFFVRTDFYYVITNYFGCKSLMTDTTTFMLNYWARWTGRRKVIDQSGIPASEMRIIRRYSIVWFVGRALALYLFVFVQVPILAMYTGEAWVYGTLLVTGDSIATPEMFQHFWFLLMFGTGMILWIRNMEIPSKQAKKTQTESPLMRKEKDNRAASVTVVADQ